MILVTGGAGFVGLNVVEQLLARGEGVRVLDKSKPALDVPFVKGDTTRPADIEQALEGADRVIHLAAITASAERDAREPQLIAQVNLVGTLNVLEAARKRGVKRFVHASTGAVFGPAGVGAPEPLREDDRVQPASMYAITKYAAERAALRLAELWKMDVRVGRLGTVYGKWEHATHARDVLSPPTEIAKIALKGGEAVFPPLGDTDYIYAPDQASALMALLDAAAPKHRVYHLSTGEAWSLPQWCDALQRKFPAFRWRQAADWKECNVLPLSPATRTRFDNRRVVDDLGWKPRFDVASSCDDFVSWLEKRA